MVAKLAKARTEMMNRLYEITDCLLREMVNEIQIELDKYLKPKVCDKLNGIYEQALSSLCNRRGMDKVIKFNRIHRKNSEYELRHEQIEEILFEFDPKEVIKNYGRRLESQSLIDAFNAKLNLNTKIDLKNERSMWVIFSKGAISIANFLADFQDKTEFDLFVNDFQRSKYSREALPMLLSKEIFGFGFALACDFLKEAGYESYPKPDRHLIDVFAESGLCEKNEYEVFKTILEVAAAVGKTPYEVDKKIWLVCTGAFYLDSKKVKDKKKKLLQLIRNTRDALQLNII